MSREPQKKDKSITELEAEIDKLQKDIQQKTSNVRALLKSAGSDKSKPISEPSEEPDIDSDLSSSPLEQLQAEFFANIATLDLIVANYLQKRLDALTYNQQLSILLIDILKLKIALEKKGCNISEFIQKENMMTRFTTAFKKLKEKGISFS